MNELLSLLTSAMVERSRTPLRPRMSMNQFCRAVLETRPWRLQRRLNDLIESVQTGQRKSRRVFVKTGHGIGKTWDMAALACWALACWRPSPVVITSAPTFRQVKDQLWREIRQMWNGTPALKQLAEATTVRIDMGEKHYAYGFSTNQPGRFQGIHAPWLLFIIDEANNFPEEIWEAIDACITGENSLVVAIGNAIIPWGRFYRGFGDPAIVTMSISSRQHPNVRAGRELIPGAVTAEWIEDFSATYASQPEIVAARVDATFPDKSEWTLIPKSMFQRALVAEVRIEQPCVLSCDVARHGSALTVLTRFRGQRVSDTWEWSGASVTQTAARIRHYYDQDPATSIVVDDVGVGGGVTDTLRDWALPVKAFNGGERSEEPDRFVNVNAEAWWTVREAMEREMFCVAASPTLLEQQLCTRMYEVRASKKIKLEAKEEYCKRTGLPSPDYADSFVMGAHEVVSRWRRMVA